MAETTVQVTAADRYYRSVTEDVKPNTLKAYIDAYVKARETVLGLAPIGYRQVGTNARGQTVVQPIDDGLKLQQRLDRLGAGFGPLMQENAEYKAQHTKTALAQIAKLGGLEAIDPSGVWAFLLDYIKRDFVTGAPVLDDAGKMQFALPGLPFRWEVANSGPNGIPGRQAAIYSVDIAVVAEGPSVGRGTASFTLLNPETAGPTGDPL